MKLGKSLTKRFAPLLLAIAMLFSPCNASKACTGARQNAMGNAGVASCNNSHAIYWNQANLSNIEKPEVSYTKQIGDLDEARYDDVISFVSPITKRLGVGIQLISGSKGNLKEDGWNNKDKWIKAGLGYLLKDGQDDKWSYAIGGALTQKTIENTQINQNNQENTRKKEGMQYEGSALAKRKNLFRKNDELNIGILARQQIGIEKNNLAVRPGIAYTIPNRLGDLTTSFEFYEIDELLREEIGKEYAKPRLGLEQTIGETLAFRAGYDGAGREGKGVFTAGAGMRYKNFGLDIAFTDKNVGWVEVSWRF